MISTNRIRLVAGCFAIALAFAASAQSMFRGHRPAEWPKVAAGARAEGLVRLYASMTPPVLANLGARFEAANPGIKIEILRLQAGQLPNAVDKERQANLDGADALITTEVVWATEQARQNAFRAPAGPASDAWPTAYMLSGVAPIVAAAPLVMVYNPNLVKGRITGYADLLRPEFKGKVGVVEPAATILVAFYEWLEQIQGQEFLPKLAAQGPRLFVSAVPITQSVISGEISISQFSTSTVAGPFVRDGAPVRVVVPTPSAGTPWVGAALASARRPNAAQVVLDFVMSAAGQTIIAGDGDAASPIGVPGSLDIKSVNILDQSRYTPEQAVAYRAKWGKVFKP